MISLPIMIISPLSKIGQTTKQIEMMIISTLETMISLTQIMMKSLLISQSKGNMIPSQMMHKIFNWFKIRF